jgi:hypothetical protein
LAQPLSPARAMLVTMISFRPTMNGASSPDPDVDPDPAHVPRIERLESRSVRDTDGVTWIVQEIRDWAYDRRASSSLVFTSDDVMRRVRNYPANWIELPAAELLRISFGV